MLTQPPTTSGGRSIGKGAVSNASRITYTPRPDATPESELSALAAVYKFLLDLHTGRDAADRSTQSYVRKEVCDESLKE